MHRLNSIRARIAARMPIVEWLPRYKTTWLRADLTAGMTLAAFTIPEAIAYAEMAGLPPQAGLYASIVPPILYMIFGSSRHLVIGPTAAISVLLASGLAALTVNSPEQYVGLAALTALLVGVIAFVAYALRLGFVVNYISESVLVGFTTGAGLYIASTQIAKLFGIAGSSGHFLERISYLIQHLGNVNPWAAALGIAGIAVVVLGERRYHKLPWALMVVLASIGVSSVIDLVGRGVHLVGEIPKGFPVFTFPSLIFTDLPAIMVLAGAAFLLSYLEGMSMARTFAAIHRYRTDSNQELLALGFTSLGAAFTQAYPVAGSFSRTSLNNASGAMTQLANGIGGASIALVVVFLAGLFTNLPEPILAAVVLVAVRGLLKFSTLRRLYTVRRAEFWPALGAFLAVLVLGILEGVIIGALISLLVVIGRASEPRISLLGKVPGLPQFADVRENPENITIPGLLIVRADEAVFYANAEAIRDQIVTLVRESDQPVQTVVIDLEMTGDLDLAGAHMLSDLRKDLLDLGVRMRLSRLQTSARLLLERTGILDEIGEEHIHPRTLFAVVSYLTGEGVSGRLACDILPDMVRCVQEMVRAQADRSQEAERDRLDVIIRQLETILQELEDMDCAGSS
ncbi:MAG: sulfate permease [Desulfomonilaceae bacterium]|nr:sulfate permease [Desulfomonilaceae bacterium]